jgi:hypothetical protein
VRGDRGRTGEVRLDHLNEPTLVRCDAMPVEEPLQIREQETMRLGQLRYPAVDRVQSPSQLDRRQPRQTELAPPQIVVAVARVVDRVDDDLVAERLDPLCDLVKPAQDRAWEVAEEKFDARATLPPEQSLTRGSARMRACPPTR